MVAQYQTGFNLNVIKMLDELCLELQTSETDELIQTPQLEVILIDAPIYYVPLVQYEIQDYEVYVLPEEQYRIDEFVQTELDTQLERFVKEEILAPDEMNMLDNLYTISFAQ